MSVYKGVRTGICVHVCQYVDAQISMLKARE